MFNESFSYEAHEYKGTRLPYRLHLPENYSIEKKYPVVLFLHGAGERGDDNNLQLKIGLVTAMQDGESPLHGAIIAAPQCPYEKQWVDAQWCNGCYSVDNTEETPYLAAAVGIIPALCKKYSCDKSRIYVMGISMGGFGSWDALARHSELFAGGFICCGSGDPSKADIYREKTIYTYHGSADCTVPVDGTRRVVSAIKASGGEKIFYKEFEGCGHNSWDAAYAEYDDMKKLFSARLC